MALAIGARVHAALPAGYSVLIELARGEVQQNFDVASAPIHVARKRLCGVASEITLPG